MTSVEPVDEILVSLSPGEGRFALRAKGEVVEFQIDRGQAAVGDVMLGRVVGVNRGLNAAFVDIGEPVSGFLAQPGKLSEGEAVPVQVTAAARRGKGAVLSRALSLQGGLLAYTPMRAGLSLSRSIVDAARRGALTALLAPLLRADEGVVVRTAAATAGDDALLAELSGLRGDWRALSAKIDGATTPPSRLTSTPALARLLATYPTVRRVSVDDPSTLAMVRPWYGGADCRTDVFDEEAGEALEQALQPEVPLPGGGRLFIEATQAFTGIDIDSGGGAPLAANLAALPEIVRQMRLRNLVGHLLIDIIPLKDRAQRARLVEALRKLVAADPTPTQIVGITPLGLIEIIRERRGPSLAEVMLDEPVAQPSIRTIGLAGLRALLRASLARPQAMMALAASPPVIAALRRDKEALAEAGRRLGRPPVLREEPGTDTFAIIEVSK